MIKCNDCGEKNWVSRSYCKNCFSKLYKNCYEEMHKDEKELVLK
ncbi:MAG: hypothetical protein ACQEQF_01815 [Bacillota bacterium]